MACWPLCCWSQRPLDSQPFSCRTHPSHMDFVEEFLSGHTLSFRVHLELEWLLPGNLGWKWLFPGNFSPNCTVLNVLTWPAWHETPQIWPRLMKSVWRKFSFSFLRGLLPCLDTCSVSFIGGLDFPAHELVWSKHHRKWKSTGRWYSCAPELCFILRFFCLADDFILSEVGLL